MVALWLPNAASESLEKKNQYILAHPYPVNLSTGTDLTTRDSQAPAPKTTPKTDSTARTFGAKRCVWIPRKKN